jgi:hypothetical protein
MIGIVGIVACSAACSSDPTDETPTGALRLFLAAMERSDWDDQALEEAFGLLDAPARERLADHASMASSPAQAFAPWEMIPQGRFRLRFTPRRMREQIDGDRAVVTVSAEGGDPSADVAMVKEAGGWRVVLEIPSPRRGKDPTQN